MLSQLICEAPSTPIGADPQSRFGLQIIRAREQILNGLLRGTAFLGTLVFLASAWPVAQLGHPDLLLIYLGIVAAIWYGALHPQLPYKLRAGILVAGAYMLGVTELLHFGYSEDTHSYLIAGAVFAAIFCGRRAAALAITVNTATMLGFGLLLVGGGLTPLIAPLKTLDRAAMLVTCLTFFAIVGVLQLAILTLFENLERAWRSEEQQRQALERERSQLEIRVTERTHELAAARDQAEADRALIAAQHHYLGTLQQLSIDLLNRRELDDLLTSIVERATDVLDADYAELMLLDHEALVVSAHSHNQPFLHHDRIRRGEGLLSWQAFDTMRPVTLDDYAAWPGRRAVYDAVPLHAVADFPIISGQRCLGVLALGRAMPGYSFTPEQCRQGELFAQLAAVALDNAQLYDAARHEVAERRQAYAALQQTAEALEAQNAELDAFAHTVAHDIKNPLTAIIGFGQLLQLGHSELAPAEIEAYLGTMIENGRKTETIVDALLLLASAQSKQPIDLRPLEMGEVVEDLGRRLHSLIDQYGATLVMPSDWPICMGYGPWVEEVWANYVSNAIKYGGSPPQVTLGADEPVEGFVRFWVRDSGQGLSEEQQARLFTAFTRLHVDEAPGHGLGLSIVERIVRRLGGEVGVQSAPGQGSTFFFTLPAVVASGSRSLAIAIPPSPPSPRSLARERGCRAQRGGGEGQQRQWHRACYVTH